MIKTIVRRIVPNRWYFEASQSWRRARERSRLIRKEARSGRPDVLLHFGGTPGDDLLCTAVTRELKERGMNRIWVMSNFPELFEGNTDVAQIIPVSPVSRTYAAGLKSRYQYLKYVETDQENEFNSVPTRHIIAELCNCAGAKGRVGLQPHFRLTAEEKEKQSWAKGMIAIQSSGLAGAVPMRNKQWYPERFQAVVDRLKDRYEFVQVGSKSDPEINGVKNLAGKTGIREAAAILSQCELYIGYVGFLMHLARAVETRSVVVYGGREAPWQSGYACNINLYTAEPCAPCWLWNRCDYNRVCMDKITVEHVVDAIEEAMERPISKPLAEEFCELDG